MSRRKLSLAVIVGAVLAPLASAAEYGLVPNEPRTTLSEFFTAVESAGKQKAFLGVANRHYRDAPFASYRGAKRYFLSLGNSNVVPCRSVWRDKEFPGTEIYDTRGNLAGEWNRNGHGCYDGEWILVDGGASVFSLACGNRILDVPKPTVVANVKRQVTVCVGGNPTYVVPESNSFGFLWQVDAEGADPTFGFDFGYTSTVTVGGGGCYYRYE